MWNISKTEDRRAKRRKFGTQGTTAYISGVLAWLLQFGLGVIRYTLQIFWFYDFRNAAPSTVFIRFQPSFIQSIIIRGWYRLLRYLAICQNLKKILWPFSVNTNSNILLTQEHMGLEIFKTLLLLQFWSDVNQTLWGYWLPWWNTSCYFSWRSAKN